MEWKAAKNSIIVQTSNLTLDKCYPIESWTDLKLQGLSAKQVLSIPESIGTFALQPKPFAADEENPLTSPDF
jgi:hypothetical protein